MLNLNKALKKGAVTGGLSCGKSTVCRFFRELGAYVVSADEIVHELLFVNQEIIQKVIALLGSEILTDNHIDRTKIAKKVFHQPSYLKSLEEILHPTVILEIKNQYELKRQEGTTPLFIAEIPLLFETNNDVEFDFTIAVIADEEICKMRFHQSTNLNSDHKVDLKDDLKSVDLKNEFDKRSKRQFSNTEKAKKATYVITNNGSLTELKETVNKLYNTITSAK